MEKAWAREKAGGMVFHLEVGQPTFVPPALALETVRSSVLNPTHQRYTSNNGLSVMREAVSQYYKKRGAQRLEPENVVTCCGAVGAFFSLCSAMLNPGDEVLIPDPAW